MRFCRLTRRPPSAPTCCVWLACGGRRSALLGVDAPSRRHNGDKRLPQCPELAQLPLLSSQLTVSSLLFSGLSVVRQVRQLTLGFPWRPLLHREPRALMRLVVTGLSKRTPPYTHCPHPANPTSLYFKPTRRPRRCVQENIRRH